jgi:hypothetical protein
MFVLGLIRNIIDIFFVIVFAMIRRGIDVVKRTILRIMLWFGSFTVLAAVIRTEGFKMAGLLTLVADASSHMRGKDLVDKERWNFIGSGGGCSPRGMNRRWTAGSSRWDIVVVGCASETGQSTSRVVHNFVVGRQRIRCLGSE